MAPTGFALVLNGNQGVGLLLAATLCMLLSGKKALKVLMWREKEPIDDADSDTSLSAGGETKAVLYPKRKRDGRAGTLMGDIVFPRTRPPAALAVHDTPRRQCVG